MKNMMKKTIGGSTAAFAMLVMLTMLVAAPQDAQAVTAAQSTVKNVVTVSYGDGAGFTTTATATNFVIVDLVAAAPTLSAPGDATVSAGGLASFTYTITTNANGEDVFTLSDDAGTTDVNVSAPTTDYYSDAALTTLVAASKITLGASDVYSDITIGVGGVATIIVPADQTPGASVNGIEQNDTVVITIGGTDYIFSVTAVTDSGSANSVGTSTIDVYSAAAVGLTATQGTLIREKQTFYLAVAVGTLQGTGDGSHTIILTASDGANPTTDTTVTTISGPSLQVDKYSANFTAASGSNATNFLTMTDGYTGASHTYFPSGSGVVAKPGETVGYVVIVRNTGAGDATNVVVVDPIPVYTTYNVGSMALDPYTNTGTTLTINDGLNVDPGDLKADSREVTVYAGDGGGGTGAYGAGTGGTLPGGSTSYVTFAVTVD